MVDFVTLQSLFARNTDSAAIDAAVDAHISAMGTPTLVRVEAVHGEGVSLVGTVDVVPMVHQQDGQGKTVPHGVIYGVPYCRVQGGASALIIDPRPGDIGFVMVAGRDMSNVVNTREASAPATFRKYSMSDCVYVGGFLNGAPAQYLRVSGGTIEAGAPVTRTTGNFSAGNGISASVPLGNGQVLTFLDGILVGVQ